MMRTCATCPTHTREDPGCHQAGRVVHLGQARERRDSPKGAKSLPYDKYVGRQEGRPPPHHSQLLSVRTVAYPEQESEDPAEPVKAPGAKR